MKSFKNSCATLLVLSCFFSRSMSSAEIASGDSPSKAKPVVFENLQSPGEYGLLPLLVAVHMGFFRETGIHAKLVSNPGMPSDSPFQIIGCETLCQREAQTPGRYKVLLFSMNSDGIRDDALVVPPNSAALRVRDLESVRNAVCVGWGPVGAPILRQMLKSNDYMGSTDNISITNQKELPSSGWDIAYLREPYLSLYLSRGRVKELRLDAFPPSRAKCRHVRSVIVLDTQTLALTARVVSQVYEAFNKAVQYIRENPVAAQAVLSAYVQASIHDEDLISRRLGIKYFVSHELPYDVLHKQVEWYFSNGLLLKSPDTLNLFYKLNATAKLNDTAFE
ncbi:MAG TPA: hypothetical protein PK876_01170 [Elusimicrobiota bacterium]|nr:hypothetical protein [Elusimicrobiota bacterium]